MSAPETARGATWRTFSQTLLAGWALLATAAAIFFFFVSWNLAHRNMQSNPDQPTAQNGQAAISERYQVVLNVRNDRTVIWNGRQIALTELSARLNRLAHDTPDFAIILRSDRNVPYANIVAVLDVCRTAHVWNVAFATNKVE